ncbi:MAG TPA: hypothetical protein VFJ12_08955 [Segeticoccus sp.]|jgi:hypothetical protein|nr:hypothetical protein [Segeticoccus sp.]
MTAGDWVLLVVAVLVVVAFGWVVRTVNTRMFDRMARRSAEARERRREALGRVRDDSTRAPGAPDEDDGPESGRP